MKVLIFALAFAAAGMASAQETELDAGRDLFRTYCWQCHGRAATGDGPMAEMLAIRTPDLTRLSVRNKGEFPFEAVARQIDGRDPVLGHGGQMPIFGPVFEDGRPFGLRPPDGQIMLTSRSLASVLMYLETLQVNQSLLNGH